MAFDSQDTNTIVTLHSSGSSRVIYTRRRLQHGLQRPAKHREKTMVTRICTWCTRILTKKVGGRIPDFLGMNILSQIAVVI